MLDRETFDEFYRYLETANQWRRADDDSLKFYYDRVSAAIDDDEYTKLVNALLDSETVKTPRDFLGSIRSAIREKAKQVNQFAKFDLPNGQFDCDEYVRFARAMRALEQLKAEFPDWRCSQRQDEFWFHRLWRQDITEDDRLYVEGKQVEQIMAMGGIQMHRPVGQTSDMEPVT